MVRCIEIVIPKEKLNTPEIRLYPPHQIFVFNLLENLQYIGTWDKGATYLNNIVSISVSLRVLFLFLFFCILNSEWSEEPYLHGFTTKFIYFFHSVITVHFRIEILVVQKF